MFTCCSKVFPFVCGFFFGTDFLSSHLTCVNALSMSIFLCGVEERSCLFILSVVVIVSVVSFVVFSFGLPLNVL